MTQQSISLDQAKARPAGKRVRFTWLRHVPAYLFLGAWSFGTIFAIAWVVLASLKTNRDVFRKPFDIPADPQFINYTHVWSNSDVGRAFLNSIVIVSIAVVLILLVSSPAAYVLSRAKFKGRGLLTMVYIAGIGIPFPL
ncbi:MAG: hypothetical protein ABI700_29970, partial [Chloroflexota bacterium]